MVTAVQCKHTGYVAGLFLRRRPDHPHRRSRRECRRDLITPIVPIPRVRSAARFRDGVTQLVPVDVRARVPAYDQLQPALLVRGNLPEDCGERGLSHYAEENGGRTFLPDTATFCRYAFEISYKRVEILSATNSSQVAAVRGLRIAAGLLAYSWA